MLLRGLLKRFLGLKEEGTQKPLESPTVEVKVSDVSIEVQDLTEPSRASIEPLNVIQKAKEICVPFLVSFEGTGPMKNGKFLAYKDPGSKSGLPITIAWGLTYHANGTPIQLGEEWDLAYAMQVKAIVLERFVQGVIALCPNLIKEDPRRLAAVVSFAYNVGIGNLKISNLRKKILVGNWEGAAKEFLKWDKAGGKVMRGLTRRRQAESNMFLLK